jgi:hypothetical protein
MSSTCRLSILTLAVALAIPGRALAQQRIHALIASGENETDWRWTSAWLQGALRDSGRFDVEVSLYPDGDLGDPDYLSRFQVVVLDYAGRRLGDTAEQRFLPAVEGGLGVVAFGAAATAFEAFDVTLRDAQHPLTAGFGAWQRHLDALPAGLRLADGPGHTLLAEAAIPSGTVPVLVASSHGAGRVVATPLGRVAFGDATSHAAQMDPQFQQLLLRASEWAATGAVTPMRRLEPNTLTPEDRAAGWQLLFDGTSASGWRALDGQGPPKDVWSVEAGCLKLSPGASAADIVNEQTFDAFELEVEWRLASPEEGGKPLPPEAQIAPILAEANLTGVPILRPSGEFNHGRVVAHDGVVEHWLNGVKLLTLYMGPDEWAARVAGGAAKDPLLGQLPLSRLVASGAGSAVWMRNMKIRRIPPAGSQAPEETRTHSVALLDGVDLAGWRWIPETPGSNLPPPFHVKDGQLVCEGVHPGYLRTEAEYGDFVLTLEYACDPQTLNPADSGLMPRVTTEDGNVPRGVEVELLNRNAGSLFNCLHFPMEVDRSRSDAYTTRALRDVERARGQWNHLEVRIQGGELTVRLNGEVVNYASKLGVAQGPIAIRSQGSKFYFRGLTLTPLQ